MFILFTNLFLARPFRLENTLECYNLRGGQGGSTEVPFSAFISSVSICMNFLSLSTVGNNISDFEMNRILLLPCHLLLRMHLTYS